MNTEPLPPLLLALGHAALEHVIPLLLLVLLVSLFIWVLFSAQRSQNFEASQFLRDETDRLSFGRLAAFGCFVIHSWAFSVWVIRGVISFNDVVLYCVTWSGSLLLLRLMDIYRGVKLGVVPAGLTQPASKPEGTP